MKPKTPKSTMDDHDDETMEGPSEQELETQNNDYASHTEARGCYD